MKQVTHSHGMPGGQCDPSGSRAAIRAALLGWALAIALIGCGDEAGEASEEVQEQGEEAAEEIQEETEEAAQD